jgi:hypothetical protein
LTFAQNAVLSFDAGLLHHSEMKIRDAITEDAPAACQVLRRSISELCVADHENDFSEMAAQQEQRIMRTKYAIDDFQQTYFVIESFEELLAACYEDFGPLYERLAAATDIEPFELVEGDEVLTRGTLAYFKKDRHFRTRQAN